MPKKASKRQVRLMIADTPYDHWKAAADELDTEPGAMLRKIAESVASPREAANLYASAITERVDSI